MPSHTPSGDAWVGAVGLTCLSAKSCLLGAVATVIHRQVRPASPLPPGARMSCTFPRTLRHTRRSPAEASFLHTPGQGSPASTSPATCAAGRVVPVHEPLHRIARADRTERPAQVRVAFAGGHLCRNTAGGRHKDRQLALQLPVEPLQFHQNVDGSPTSATTLPKSENPRSNLNTGIPKRARNWCVIYPDL